MLYQIASIIFTFEPIVYYIFIFFSFLHFRDHDMCLDLTGEYMSPGICKYTIVEVFPIYF